MTNSENTDSWTPAAVQLAARLEQFPDFEFELPAPEYLATARDLEEQTRQPDMPALLRARTLVELGNALRTNGEFTTAVEILDEAIGIADRLPDNRERQVLLGTAHLRMSATLDVVDSIVAGFEHLDLATSLFETAGDKAWLARSWMVRGTLQARIDNFEEAETSLQNALSIYRRIGETKRYGTALSNLCAILRLMGRPEDAVVAGREAMSIGDSLWLRTTSAGNLTFALADAGELEEAVRMAALTGELVAEINVPAFTIEYKRIQATILMKQNNPAAARDRLREAFQEAERLGFVRDMTELHGLISTAYRDLGDYAKAYSHLEQYHKQLLARSRKAAASQLEVQKWRLELEAARTQAEQERSRREQLARSLAELNTTHAQLSARAVELEWSSYRDSLTELANRRYFDERLADYAARSRRTGAEVSLLLIDLDRFKGINDRFGHPVGDEVLRKTGRILQSLIRRSDLTARIGGEEFAVLLTDISGEELHAMAEKLRQAFASHDWDEIEPGIRVTISIGTASMSESGNEPLKLFELADRRLYQAKRAGRNKVISSLSGADQA